MIGCSSNCGIPGSLTGATRLNNWTTDIPTEPGTYWFYGDEHAGQCGGDFQPGHKFDQRLSLVYVNKISNGLMAHSSGAFITLSKFNPSNMRSVGVVGYWKKCPMPEAPADTEGLFV